MLRQKDHWVWDSWVAHDGDAYHLFYLQAPRSLGDATQRHLHATIGHAVSRDLVEWTVVNDALAPDPDGWDDLALWTGSVARADDGRWWMFYTGLGHRGLGARDQRIGAAVSDDLHRWTRVTDQPLDVDPRWYKTSDSGFLSSETWRDPFVFKDPEGDGWHMLVTARAKDAAPQDDGVLAHARSHDLVSWAVQPPVCAPGAGFGQLEVSQVRVIHGTPVLVFTCHPEEQARGRVEAFGEHCTWSVIGSDVRGPWDLSLARPFTAEPDLFAAPLIQNRSGDWVFLGFRNTESRGLVQLEIIDPLPVELGARGLLSPARPSPP